MTACLGVTQRELTRGYSLEPMESIESLLEELTTSPDGRLATLQADEDMHWLASLVQIRKDRNITQLEIAQKLGVSQATISAFERLGNDPHLSTVRRYCRALGVLVRHQVDPTPDLECKSDSLTHMSDASMFMAGTAAARFRTSRSNVRWPAATTAARPPVRPNAMKAAPSEVLV